MIRKSILKRLLMVTIFSLLFVVLVVCCLLYVSPSPFVSLITSLPNKSTITPLKNQKELEKNVNSHKELTYKSKYKNSILDVYTPKNVKNPPVVLFFHGGGFITGDKDMAKYLGPAVASKGFAFISVNYLLAPQSSIVEQNYQISDAINSVDDISKKYDLDGNKLFLSGSSAGGYLALQVITLMKNAEYAERIGSKKIIRKEISGILLYSAPFDLTSLKTLGKDRLFTRLGVFELGWALTNNRYWRSDAQLGKLYDLDQYVSKNMPPMFITDGNQNTFTAQAKNYSEKLEQNNVKVKTLFFEKSEKVGHGYQLNMQTEQAEQAFRESIKFLNNYSN